MILRKKHRKITLTDEKKYLLRLLTIEKKTEKNQPCGRSEFDDSFLFETGVIETKLVSLFVSI